MNTLESPTKTSHCTSQLIFLSGHLVTWLFDFGSGSRWPITVQGKGKSWLSRPPTPRLLIKTVYATTAAVCQAVIMQSSSRLAPIAFLLFLHDSPSSCDCSLHFTVTFCHCSFFPGSSIFQTPHDLVIPPFAHSSHPELVCGAFFFLAHFSLPPSLTHSLPHSFLPSILPSIAVWPSNLRAVFWSDGARPSPPQECAVCTQTQQEHR